MRKLLSIAVLSVLATSTPTGAEVVRHYTEREGLPGNRVTDIAQDRRGFIWTCSRNSISRFDGEDFLSYSMSIGDEDSFFDNICAAPDGKVWVATTSRPLLFDPRTEQFTKFSDICPNGDKVWDVRMMSYSPDGTLWMASTCGIFSWNEGARELTKWHDRPSLAAVCSGEEIWLADYANLYAPGIVGLVLKAKVLSDESGSDKITALHSGTDGALWIGTWDGRLYRYDKAAGSVSPALSSRWPYPLNASRIHDIEDGNADELILATDSGLLLFDKKTGKLSLKEKESAGNSYYRVFQDREGGVWIATYFNGLEYISPLTRSLELYTDTGIPGSLKGSAVSDFCEDADGNIWISTENGGLNLFNTKTRSFTDYSSVSYNNIHALLLDGRNLWMGTFSHGLERMDLGSGAITRFRYSPTDPDSICDDHVYSLCKDKDGNICVATLHGVCRYERRSGKFIKEEKLGRNFYTCVFVASDGVLWAASKSSGIWMKAAGSSRWTHFFPGGNNCLPLQTDRVNKITEGADGTIYAATDKAGILYFDRSSGEFRQYFTAEGLPEVSCYGVLQDKEGSLWISSNSGILKFSPGKGLEGVFGAGNGMQGNLFNLSACRTTSDGRMWFGGVNGFNCFLPEELKAGSVAGAPTITSISYNTKEGEKKQSLPSEGPVLHWKSPSITVSFCPMSYTAAGSYRYAWRMDGGGKNWSETSGNSVNIINIRPGKHLFEVKVCGRDGVWSEDSAKMSFKVRRNPLLSWWAMILYLSAAISVLVWAVRMRMKSRDIELEKETVQSKIDFFGNVAHEIKTPVTLIKAPLEQIIASGNWNDSDRNNLEIISKNTDRLLELVRQLLDFRKIDKSGFEIRLEDVDPCLLAKDMTARFQPVDGDVRIVCELPESSFVCRLDKEAVTKILSNLMMNALKYARTLITVKVARTDSETLELSVSDDGPGIPQESLDNVFKPFFQVNPAVDKGFGIGLSLVTLLAEKHQGKVSVENVEDSGCKILVTLPLISCGTRQTLSDPLVQDTAEKPVMLIVEDTADMLGFLSGMFSKDWKIKEAKDGLEALEIIENEQIDFILSDLMMPRLDGLGLLKAVRENKTTSSLPFVLLTAKDDAETKIEGLEAGADAYIEKPFSPAQMAATIEGICSVRRKITEKYASDPEKGFEGMRKEDSEWLAEVDTLLLEHLDSESIGPEVLAARLSTGKTAFQKRLKALTGMTVSEYIRVFRMKRAAALLRDGRYKIGEVAFMVGFSDQSYFTKCFCAQFGVLPKDYAKK